MNAEIVLTELMERVANAMERVDAMQKELQGIARSLFELKGSLGGVNS